MDEDDIVGSVSVPPANFGFDTAASEGGSVSEAEPPLVTLSRLQAVPITAVWPTEPHHFTPWLLKNSVLLSEVLGVDVELEFREYKVGKFSLDIIGREVATGEPVIVENQFGATDHLQLWPYRRPGQSAQ